MTRVRVVVAGERLLRRRDGRLSMRRLARVLGITPAALYHHVPGGLAELLSAIAARVLGHCTHAAIQAAVVSEREDALANALAAVYGAVAKKPALAYVAASPRCKTAELYVAWCRLIDVLDDPAWHGNTRVPRGILSSLVMALLLMAARRRETGTDAARDLIAVTLIGARRVATAKAG